jgi:inosose dehydratase
MAAPDLAGVGRASRPAGGSGRIAAAPISWGVSEVPGWGHQLPAGRVLAEMRDLGFVATEFGPDGFLPDDPAATRAVLDAHGLAAVGGFVPVVLHDAARDAVADVEGFLDRAEATGAGVLVLAAATGLDGYDERPELDDAQWSTLLANLDRIADRAAERGVVATIHPHIGTVVETAEHVDRIVAGSRIGLCLDTGHLLAAGSDPVEVADAHAARVRHVHLKDVDAALGARVADGSLAFSDAIREGLFTRIGAGDVDVAGIVRRLEAVGFDGWYVLEQDIALDGPPEGEGPAADVAACLAAVRAELGAR